MATEPVERIDEHQSGETPEDVAILYSWANLQGAKYRDFSANRREYRAQMRHRAAEQLRLMELRAQSEAEAAAAEAEAESAAAHAEADAATVKLAASRSLHTMGPAAAPEEILKEKEVEEFRKASLREAAQQARRAAAERLEAARRAEAAALADSIARREEREIAEAQASSLRQAAQYHDSEVRSKQMAAQHPDSEDQVPGRISDPYSPQILAEGEYYDGPGTPPSELVASRFRTQREYIERSTGTELRKFKMPPLFDEDAPPHRTRLESDHDLRHDVRDFALEADARRRSEMDAAEREFYADRQRPEVPNATTTPRNRPDALKQAGNRQQEAMYGASVREPDGSEPGTYRAPRDASDEGAKPQRADGVRRPRRRDEEAYPRDYRGGVEEFEARGRFRAEDRIDAGFDGSLLNGAEVAPRDRRTHIASEPDRLERARPEPVPSEAGWKPASEDNWHQRRSGPPPPARQGFEESPQFEQQRVAENEAPHLYSVKHRPSGSWLRQISATAMEEESVGAPDASLLQPSESYIKRVSTRPSVEATYAEGQSGGASAPQERQPSGFRPPWLSQAQTARPPGSRRASESAPAEKPAPQWLYPPPREMPVAAPATPVAALKQSADWRAEPAPDYYPASNYPAHSQAANGHGSNRHGTNRAATNGPDTNNQAAGYQSKAADPLQTSREQVASRWFALKGVFARADVAPPAERFVPREKNSTPMLAVYSLAGGVGKTSLVATLGRALSSLGEKVLLTDTTSHGLLPFYFGAKEVVSGTVRTFTPPNGSTDAEIHLVSYDMVSHDHEPRGAEAQSQAAMFDSLAAASHQVNRVLLDLNQNNGGLIQRLARFSPTILIPVAADMNSILSLQAMEKKFAAMQSGDGEPLRPVYLLNQFDASLPLHLDLREVLRQQLGDRLLPFVIRRAPGISEALAEGMTIIDYDLDSPATQDFMGLANWVRSMSVAAPMGAAAGLRNLRWSER